MWLIERVLLCRWDRGGSKPAPTFSNVRSPCSPPVQALLGATPGSLAPAFWALRQGGSPWWAYPNGEWFLGARAHSSAWNHRAGGGTHVFINTVRAQIMSHCKILILAGVLYCLVEIQAGKFLSVERPLFSTGTKSNNHLRWCRKEHELEREVIT